MTIITIRIPGDVTAAFDKAFEGEDKDAVLARLIREAIEKRGQYEAAKEESAVRRHEAVDEILALRSQPPYFSDTQIKQAREEGPPVTLVIDSSVAANWILAESPREQDSDKAVALLGQIAMENTAPSTALLSGRPLPKTLENSDFARPRLRGADHEKNTLR